MRLDALADELVDELARRRLVGVDLERVVLRPVAVVDHRQRPRLRVQQGIQFLKSGPAVRQGTLRFLNSIASTRDRHRPPDFSPLRIGFQTSCE